MAQHRLAREDLRRLAAGDPQAAGDVCRGLAAASSGVSSQRSAIRCFNWRSDVR